MNNDIFENTVAARGQLKDTEYITYTHQKGRAAAGPFRRQFDYAPRR